MKRINDGTTHWAGCEREHHACALARLERAEAGLQERGVERDNAEQEVENLRAALAKAEADAAAMRLALEAVRDWYGLDGDGITDPVRQQVIAALTSTAGEDVAAVYRAAVAWRKEPVPRHNENVLGDLEMDLIAAVDKAEGRTE